MIGPSPLIFFGFEPVKFEIMVFGQKNCGSFFLIPGNIVFRVDHRPRKLII